jgi:hypothetical protein
MARVLFRDSWEGNIENRRADVKGKGELFGRVAFLAGL